MKVIVSADDLGRDERTNAAIFDLMAAGRVTSASLIANGSSYEDAVKRIGDFPSVSIGVHLNLTEGFPLVDSPALKPILDSDGAFLGGKIRRYLIDKPLRDAVLAEWTAQVEKVSGSGVRVSHLDGHHHVHRIPALFTTLKRLQRRFGIRRVRSTRNIHAPDDPSPWSMRFMKAVWILCLRYNYRTSTTDGFAPFKVFLQRATASPLRMRSVEVMLHPGHPKFIEETRLVYGEWWKALPFEIQTVSYHDL
jgi:predicted glycoside hydrolase/deacetylase ChbG (UPF0249 family)